MIRSISRAGIAAAFTLCLFFGLTAPAGAVTIGQTCSNPVGGPSLTFQTGVAAGASYVVPFDGILTSWTSDRSAYGSHGMSSAYFGLKTATDEWTITRATPFQYVAGNSVGSFLVRQPVKAGETLGLVTYNSTPVMCQTALPGDTLDGAGFGPVGTAVPSSQAIGYRADVSATVERDADADGYGDESQDKCPQSAAWQNTCPELKIAQRVSASASEIKILASTTTDTKLTATATVKISGKAATFKSKAVAFTAGTLKTFKLKLPKSVLNALKKKNLKATVTLTGNGIANAATATSKITLKKRK